MKEKILIDELKDIIQTFQPKCEGYKKTLREKETADKYKLISRVLDFFKTLQDVEIHNYSDLFINYQSDIIDFIELSNSIINDSYLQKSQNVRNSLGSFAKSLENGLIKNLRNPPKDPLENIKNERILADYEKKLKDLQNSFDAYRESAQIIITDLEKIRDKEVKKVDETLKKVQIIESSATNAKTAFSEEHKLHEAKQYWQDKSYWHKIKALVFFIFFVGIVSFVGYEGSLQLVQKDLNTTKPILIDNNTTETKASNNVLISNSDIFKYIRFLFLLSLVIWISRILLKITFSNLHLAEEAHEKETMILIYLALIKEGGGLEENDRKLILEAIFRPSTNGLIKDETNVTLLDLVNAFKR